MRTLFALLFSLFTFSQVSAQQHISLELNQADCDFSYFPGLIGVTAYITMPENFTPTPGLNPYPALLIRFDDPNLPTHSDLETANILNYDSNTRIMTIVCDIPGLVYVPDNVQVMYFDARIDYVDLSGNIPTETLNTHPDSAYEEIVLPWTITSVDEAAEKEVFTAYPNPFINELYVTSDEVVELYDISGSLVATHNPNDRYISTSTLPSGMYFARKENGETLKILKQ